MTSASHDVSGSESFCETEVVLSHITFSWVIKNFSFCCAKDGYIIIESRKFQCGASKNYEWQLKLRQIPVDESKKGSRSFAHDVAERLQLLIYPSRNIKYAVIKCTLKNNSAKELYCFTKEIRQPNLLKSEYEWKVTEELPLCRKTVKGTLPNDLLKICVEGTVSHDQVSTFIQSSEITYTPVSEKFISSLASLRDNDKFSDFTIKVQGRKFPVHRAILGACSPVLDAMFEHDMQEKNSRLLEITDFEAEVVQRLLNFMYTQKIPEFTDLKSVTDLYEIADKYGVEDLRELCKKYLISILSQSNVQDILQTADRHSDMVLKNEILSFVQSHPEINLETVMKRVTIPEKVLNLLRPVMNLNSSIFFDKPNTVNSAQKLFSYRMPEGLVTKWMTGWR